MYIPMNPIIIVCV